MTKQWVEGTQHHKDSDCARAHALFWVGTMVEIESAMCKALKVCLVAQNRDNDFWMRNDITLLTAFANFIFRRYVMGVM